MPSVDTGYNSYRRDLGEIEDDFKSEIKRRDKQSDTRAEALSKKHAELQTESERANEKLLESTKESARKDISRERDLARAEVDKMRAASYDKFGRYQGNDADATRRQLESLTVASDQAHKQDRERLAASETRADSHAEEILKEANERTTKAVDKAREAANDSYTQLVEEKNNQYSQFRKDSEEKYNQLSRSMTEEVDFQKGQAKRAVDETEAAGRYRDENLRNRESERLRSTVKALDERNSGSLRAQAESNKQESQQLRDELRQMNADRDAYAHAKATGSRDAIKEYDNDWRSKLRSTSETYESVINQQKNAGKDRESGISSKLMQEMSDRDMNSTMRLRKQLADDHSVLKDAESTFNRSAEQMELSRRNDGEQAEKRLMSAMDRAGERGERTLQAQAKTNNETMSSMRKNFLSDQKALESALQEQRTTPDATLISTAAEDSLRKTYSKEHEKVLAADEQRNQAKFMEQKQSADEKMDELRFKTDRNGTLTAQKNAAELFAERGRLLDQLEETEYGKQNAMRAQEMAHDRSSKSEEKRFGTSLDRQRQQYETIFEEHKNDTAAKMSDLRQQLAFETKMTKRASATRENELIRDYEKRLTDQKTDYDSLLTDTRTKADQAVRESDKKSKQMLEDQSKTYEQRIAQLEGQFKERERFLSQNHSDELDRMKRSNALLIQKKS